MKKLLVFALLLTSFSTFAIDDDYPTYSAPDAGSTAVLLVAAGAAVSVIKRFKK